MYFHVSIETKVFNQAWYKAALGWE